MDYGQVLKDSYYDEKDIIIFSVDEDVSIKDTIRIMNDDGMFEVELTETQIEEMLEHILEEVL